MLPYYFIYTFINNFSLLFLCKINILDIFNMVDFFQDFSYIAKYWNSDWIKILAGSVCGRKEEVFLQERLNNLSLALFWGKVKCKMSLLPTYTSQLIVKEIWDWKFDWFKSFPKSTWRKWFKVILKGPFISESLNHFIRNK